MRTGGKGYEERSIFTTRPAAAQRMDGSGYERGFSFSKRSICRKCFPRQRTKVPRIGVRRKQYRVRKIETDGIDALNGSVLRGVARPAWKAECRKFLGQVFCVFWRV